MKYKIAVIGGGIFGITSALFLDQKGHDVYLFEKNESLLTEASFGNQFRLHRGYHYPRSPKTVSNLLKSSIEFEKFYDLAIKKDCEHYYCIASSNSLITPNNYLKFCDENNLEYEIVKNADFVKNVDLTIKVKENLIDYQILKLLCYKKITSSQIKTRFNTRFKKSNILDFDIVVNCSYKDINFISESVKNYQYELCEKIMVKVPDSLSNKSIVIMDGPFMCIDPFAKPNFSLLGNVVHAIHSSNTGVQAIIPNEYEKYLQNIEYSESIKIDKKSNFDKFIETGKVYIPDMEKIEYIGSKMVVRAVLPNVEKTDERPTIVTMKDNIIDVFSGKIDTCISAARSVISYLE